jgi:subtilisin-like proprotein convertase family protein
MKIMRRLITILLLQFFIASAAQSSTLPPNHLNLNDKIYSLEANLDERQFSELIGEVTEQFRGIIAAHGGNLQVEKLWEDPTVNAQADQEGTTWIVRFFGGLARRPEITPDAFTMVVCHEVGHHLGGYPFYSDEFWAAVEGEADYFASQVCLKKIWRNQNAENATFRYSVDPLAKAVCDSAWASVDEQNLCYRISEAGQSLSRLFAALESSGDPAFSKPDPKQADETLVKHPPAQCRLDTLLAGDLCNMSLAEDIIPGRSNVRGQNGRYAELDALRFSCANAQFQKESQRPRCWYRPVADSMIGVNAKEFGLGGSGQVHRPGDIVDLPISIENGASIAIKKVEISPVALTAHLSISQQSETIDLLPSHGKANLASPFRIQISRAATCGEILPLQFNFSSGKATNSIVKTIRVGDEVLGAFRAAPQLKIPDGDITGVVSEMPVVVKGNPEQIKVGVNIFQPYIGGLKITLTAPSGEEYILRNQEGGKENELKREYIVNASQFTQINGTWKLRVGNIFRGDTGILEDWSLSFLRLRCD